MKYVFFTKKVISATAILCVTALMTIPAYGKTLDNVVTVINTSNDVIIKSDDEILRTVSGINELRKSIGLSGYNIDETLNTMATIHSKYMNHNREVTSIEDSSKLYYRGKYPWDRADYLGYKKNFVYEFVNNDYANYMELYNNLLNEPQSRYILLNPMYTDIGMALHESYFTIELGGDNLDRSTSFFYPYDGQDNITSSWKGTTLDLINLDSNTLRKRTGLPITYMYYGDDIASISNKTFSIVNKKDGSYVPYKYIEPGAMRQNKNMLTLVPLEVYDYDTEYEVSMKFVVKLDSGISFDIDKKFSFKTESEEAAQRAVEQQYMTREKFIEKVITIPNLDIELIEPLEIKFNDVDINTSSSIYINTGSELGLINGYPDGRFGPTLNISKEQAYKILVSAYRLKLNKPISIEKVDLSVYKDAEKISPWAMNDMKVAKALGIIIDEEGYIEPHAYLTRDEFDEIVKLFNAMLSE